MLYNWKALLVILALTWPVFFVARPICERYMAPDVFRRRRNVWYALTIVAFNCPAFWMYAIFSAGLLYWASKRDDNPLALYVLVTFVIPNVSYFLPTVLINQLFDLNQYRILSFFIIFPLMRRIFARADGWGTPGLKLADFVLMSFLLLQVVLGIPYASPTMTLRTAFLFTVDTFVVFYCFSRIADLARLRDLMACLWLSGALLAPVAVFEWAKGWLLYTDLSGLWGDPAAFAYLFRGNSLRAQASAGHSINLSYVLAMTLGAFLYLQDKVDKPRHAWFILALMTAGVFATGSRGGWLTAAIVAAIFLSARPNAGKRLARVLIGSVVLIALMYATPLRESVLSRLPIIGTADQDTIEYRQQLLDVSWTLIKQNPFFGDPFAASHMEEMRQGQGIIDIVNGYIFAALFTGGVGLSLLVSQFAISVWKGGKTWLAVRQQADDDGVLGASLLGLMIASLFYIATAGYGITSYIVAALLLSYATSVGSNRSTLASAGLGDASFATRFKHS